MRVISAPFVFIQFIPSVGFIYNFLVFKYRIHRLKRNLVSKRLVFVNIGRSNRILIELTELFIVID
jgi:hypothetical protein